MGKSSPSRQQKKSKEESAPDRAAPRTFKKEVRILGVDDSPFKKGDRDALIIGVVFRGANYLDGVLSARIEVDGNDVSGKLSEMILKTRHRDQLQVIMLNGITFAGFNIADLLGIHESTGMPVISTVRRMPDFLKIRKAIFSKFPDANEKWRTVMRAGRIHKSGTVFFQCAGMNPADAARLVEATSVHSRIPEPIRVAHLIAGGVVSGESRGGA